MDDIISDSLKRCLTTVSESDGALKEVNLVDVFGDIASSISLLATAAIHISEAVEKLAENVGSLKQN